MKQSRKRNTGDSVGGKVPNAKAMHKFWRDIVGKASGLNQESQVVKHWHDQMRAKGIESDKAKIP